MALVAVEDKGKEGMGRIRLRVLPDAAADMIEKNLKVMDGGDIKGLNHLGTHIEWSNRAMSDLVAIQLPWYTGSHRFSSVGY